MIDKSLANALTASIAEGGMDTENVNDDGGLTISNDPLNPEGMVLGVESIDMDRITSVMERQIEIAFCKNPKTGITKRLVFAPDELVYKLIVCDVEEMELRSPLDAVDEYNDRAI